MMYPRLKLARNLLQDDGVMFMSIADHEFHNLRSAMDEVFGPENFIATVIWHKMDSPKNTARHFSEDHDYVLVFAKNAELWRPNGLARTECGSLVIWPPGTITLRVGIQSPQRAAK
jgi:adenine-specific DNA-methyltransferase